MHLKRILHARKTAKEVLKNNKEMVDYGSNPIIDLEQTKTKKKSSKIKEYRDGLRVIDTENREKTLYFDEYKITTTLTTHDHWIAEITQYRDTERRRKRQ